MSVGGPIGSLGSPGMEKSQLRHLGSKLVGVPGVSLLTPPAKMCKPSVQPLNAFAVCIQWVPPVDAAAQRGGGFGGDRALLIKGYRLRYRTVSLDDKPLGEFVDVGETWPPDTSQATLKWLSSGLCYVFEVSAFNDAGQGDWSYSSDPFLMPRRPDEPGLSPRSFGATAPALLTSRDLGASAGASPRLEEGPPLAISKNSNSVEISWKPPCHRGAPILAYDIKFSKDPQFAPFATKEMSAPGNTTRMVVDNLDSNTIYYFMHRARNEVGSSSWSKPSHGIATLARSPVAPLPPVRLGAPHLWQATEIMIKWEAPDSDGMPIQHYRVNLGRVPDMRDALEVEMGSKAGSGTITGQRVAAPSTPRPGFSKDLYALTQLRVRGLRPNTVYYFQVQANSQVGASPWSAPSASMRTTTAPPGRCGQAKFISGSCHHGIRMYWSPPDSYDLPITRYDIRVSRSPSMKDSPAELSGVTVERAEVVGAGPEDVEATAAGEDCWWVPGADHYCQVRAWNEAGVGAWSLVSEPMPVVAEPPAAPDAPGNFTMFPCAIVVRWKAPDPLGSPITGYRLRYDTTRSMQAPTDVEGLQGTYTEFGVPHLEPHLSYYFQVAAVNGIGEGPWSPASQPVSVLQMPPGKLSPPFLLQRTQTSVTVGFVEADVSDPLTRQLVRSYTVLYSHAPGTLGVSSAVGAQGFRRALQADPRSTECDDLHPGKACEFRVVAVNEFGEGIPSEAAFFNTDTAAPDPPRPPKTKEVEARAIMLTVIPGDDNGESITHFFLQVECMATHTRWELGPLEVVDTTELRHCVDNLNPGATYRFRAATQNTVGRSVWSAASEESLTAADAPEAVIKVRVSEVRTMSFKIHWDPPVHNGAQVTKYTVAWMVVPPEEPVHNARGRGRTSPALAAIPTGWREAETSEVAFTCEECLQGCLAYAKVAAHNEAGVSPFSEQVQVTLQSDVPFAPVRPFFGQVSYTSFRVTWAMHFDGGEEITGYILHFVETASDGRPEAARDQGEIVLGPQRMFCDVFNLCPKREYVTRVAARNAVGLGPWSAFSLPQRLLRPQPPAAPGKPVFVSSTVTSLTVRLQLPESHGSTIVEQVFRLSKDPAVPAGNCVEIALPSQAPVTKPVVPRSPLVASAPLPGATSGRRPLKALKQERAAGREATGQRSSEQLEDAEAPEAPQTEGEQPKDSEDASAALRVSGEMRLKRSAPGQCVFELQPLKGGTNYYVACAARNTVGLGPFGPVGGPMLTLQAVPLPVVLVSFGGKDCTSVHIAWDEPDDQGSPLLRYALRCITREDRLFELSYNEEGEEDGKCDVPEHSLEVKRFENPEKPSFTVTGLLPGTCYYAAVRCCNSLGWSPWVRADGFCRTDPMPPTKMMTLQPVPEVATPESITFQWNLPDPRGGEILAIEIRYVTRALEQGEILRAGAKQVDTVLGGQRVVMEPDGVTGQLPLQHRLELLPAHCVVVAVARAINVAGMGEWSDPPIRDLAAEDLDVDCITAPAGPDAPQAPVFQPDSLLVDAGTIDFSLGVGNGLLHSHLTFRLFSGEPGADFNELLEPLGQEGQAPLREWQVDVPREEKLLVLHNDLHRSRCIEGLEPGTCYAMQVCADNPAGTSEWSPVGPMARTKPDRPRLRGPMLLDASSPVHICVKWLVPHHNGAAIRGYGIRWNDKAPDLPAAQWTVIAEDDVRSSMQESEVTRGALALSIDDLHPEMAHYFQYYARNAVGCSEWSEPATFYTRPSPPARTALPLLLALEPREAGLEWHEPNTYGTEIVRYEVLCSRDRFILLWARLVFERLWWSPSLEHVLGLWGLIDAELHHRGELEERGIESLSDLNSHEACFKATETPSVALANLIPGATYHAMVRAMSDKGNGKWSAVCELVTPPAVPGKPRAVRLESLDSVECSVSFVMPYHNGRHIFEAIMAVSRVDGPLADEEVDPSTGQPHQHHVRRDIEIDPWATPLPSDGVEERQAFTITGLLPGTDYEVHWACRNACGLGAFSDGTPFTTKSGLPDMPESLFASGGF